MVLAARKAFVMNVIGDVGMILAAFILFLNYHAVSYSALFKAVPKSDNGTLELAAFLLLLGGVAKSAQLPLHTWLPDAMEGPTPVSALIHAATMVTAGVYLVGRMHPVYDMAVHALHDEQDMRKWGGIWHDMRSTSITFAIGSLALVGIFPVVGFWSKELVLGDTFSRFDNLALTLWAIGFLTALLTGFYTGRMWWLAFWARPAAPRHERLHEAR